MCVFFNLSTDIQIMSYYLCVNGYPLEKVYSDFFLVSFLTQNEHYGDVTVIGEQSPDV